MFQIKSKARDYCNFFFSILSKSGQRLNNKIINLNNGVRMNYHYHKKVFAVIILLLSFTYPEETFQFKGFIQNWFSYNNQGSGFNVRRVMLKSYGKINPKVSWYAQYGWNQQKPALMDAAIKYSPDKLLNTKIGRFSVPGSRFGTLAPSSKLTFIERPMSVKKWNSFNGYTSFRSVGVQIGGEFTNFSYKTMISNNQADNLYNPRITNNTYSENEDMRFIGRIEYGWRNIKLGTFFSSPINKDPFEQSYGADLVFDKKPIKFRGGYIHGYRDHENSQMTYSGLISELSYTIKSIQPAFRYDLYDPSHEMNENIEVDIYHNFTLGINYYPDKNIKIQANYLVRKEKMVDPINRDDFDNNLFYINLQYKFGK